VRSSPEKLIQPNLANGGFRSTVVVVGANGELGMEFARQLQKKNVKVIQITRSNWGLLQNRTVELLNELTGCYVIIAVGSNSKNRSIDIESNVIATRTSVKFANFVNAKGVIHLSTGGLNVVSEHEESKNIYLETKAISEFILRSECTRPFEIMRLYFPIGPNQKGIRLIPSIYTNLKKGFPIRMRSDGGPLLTLTNRSEAVDWILRYAFTNAGNVKKTINVASGINHSILDILSDLLNVIPETKPIIEYDEELKDCINGPTPGYNWSRVDIEALGVALGVGDSIVLPDAKDGN
jgi:nucleoside-diphosphate-sugar epimerase